MPAIVLLLGLCSPAAAGPEVEVALHNGVPVALIDGRPLDLSARILKPGAEARVDAGDEPVVIVPATAAHDPYTWAPDVWISPEGWDYSHLDSALGTLVSRSPDVWVLLRVFVSAPDWWMEQNPRDAIVYGDGSSVIEVTGVRGAHGYPSYASEAWRQASADAVGRLITHVEAAPYADRVIGYVLADGEEGRWAYWGTDAGRYADYGSAQRRAFVLWLREKYSNDIRKLRAAWQKPLNPLPPMAAPDEDEVPVPVFGWDDVAVPSEEERKAHRSQGLLDPAFSPAVVDYNLFHAKQLADFLVDLAAVAKQACMSRKLVGVAYGHILTQAAHPDALQTSGHAALPTVLGDPRIDLISAPAARAATAAGGVTSVWSSVRDSVQARGKLWVEEDLGPEETENAFERERALVNGGVVWSADSGGRDARDPAASALNWDRGSVSQIAVIVDHYSLAYLAQGDVLSKPLLTDQFGALATLGAPYDVWLLDDLIGGRMPEYSLYIMLNAFTLDARAREAVKRVVARDDHTVLWIFAPGAIDRTFSGSAALDLTGLSIGFITHEAPLRVRVIDPSHPLVDGVPKGLTYGTTADTGPIFYALPARGDIIGAITVPARPNAEARDWPGLVTAEMGDWTSVYSAAPDVPTDILRGIARHAGVHFYAEPGDVVLANASMVAIHALQAGDQRVHLRWPATVWDIRTGEKLGTDVDELTLSMDAAETRVLYFGDPACFRPD